MNAPTPGSWLKAPVNEKELVTALFPEKPIILHTMAGESYEHMLETEKKPAKRDYILRPHLTDKPFKNDALLELKKTLKGVK